MWRLGKRRCPVSERTTAQECLSEPRPARNSSSLRLLPGRLLRSRRPAVRLLLPPFLQVAVKVQRPNVLETVSCDLFILRRFSQTLREARALASTSLVPVPACSVLLAFAR